jgi:hypothetical protein
MSQDQIADTDVAPAAAEEPGTDVEQAGPAPMLAGTFAIYEDGTGGYVLVTDTQDHGVSRKHIPAAMVKMVTGGGLLAKRFAGVFG